MYRRQRRAVHQGEFVNDGPLVAVLDYGIGNLRSAQKALGQVGADARLSADPALINQAAADPAPEMPRMLAGVRRP